MRIKKRNIRENIDTETSEKIDDYSTDIKDEIENIRNDFKNDDVEDPEALELATKAVTDIMVNEASVSDSQRKFFNAVHKCKVEGDCGSDAIKKAADSMSMGDIEDFAYTKGELPDSVDEEKETLLPGMMDKDGKSIPATCFHPIGLAESVRPRMTKNELTETVKNIGKNIKYPRTVIKTLKIKDIKK